MENQQLAITRIDHVVTGSNLEYLDPKIFKREFKSYLSDYYQNAEIYINLQMDVWGSQANPTKIKTSREIDEVEYITRIQQQCEYFIQHMHDNPEKFTA